MGSLAEEQSPVQAERQDGESEEEQDKEDVSERQLELFQGEFADPVGVVPERIRREDTHGRGGVGGTVYFITYFTKLDKCIFSFMVE